MSRNTKNIERDINSIQKKMKKFLPMRPGLLRQTINKKSQTKFWQLKYTYKNKSKTEYVRPKFLQQVRREIANYKEFRAKYDEMIELSIKLSKLKIELQMNKEKDIYGKTK